MYVDYTSANKKYVFRNTQDDRRPISDGKIHKINTNVSRECSFLFQRLKVKKKRECMIQVKHHVPAT